MRDTLEFIIPCLAVGFIFISIFGFIGFMRYMRYKEVVSLAEKGLLREREAHNGARNGRDSLRWGVMITALGLALCIGIYPVGFIADVEGTFPLHFGPWMLVGLVPTFFGLGLLVLYAVGQEERQQESAEELSTVIEWEEDEVTEA